MPRPQRNHAEVEAVKNKILQHAVELINKVGFEGFTMNKLADMMGVSAPSIYSYYKNKDDLYLNILTLGFEELYRDIEAAYLSCDDPFERLDAIVDTYMHFGLHHSNFYNLMFTWHVPHYKDYIGTPLESTAHIELLAAMKVTHLVRKAIRECVEKEKPMSEEDVRFYHVYFWSNIHGYIAGVNNTLIDYMHDDPLSIKNKITDLLTKVFRAEMKEYCKGEAAS